ncbi:MAG: GAF domain-containing protein [Kouleothrix sp.]|nr:GAF domain-containing protein [Kouleothrix sp.]
MTADQLLQYLSWTVYGLLFVIGLFNAVRRPRRVNVDIALLFSFPAALIAITVALALGLISGGPIPRVITSVLILSLPYLLVRLLDDFMGVAPRVKRGAEIGLLLAVVAVAALSPSMPIGITLLMVLYLVVLLIYAAVVFIRESRRASGVTRRRMLAVAAGALLLMLEFLLIGVSAALGATDLARIMVDLSGLASGVGFFLGFAPPSWLRRTWQEPELRAFLGRAASLPRLPSTAMIITELERGASASVGAPSAWIGQWDEASQLLRFERDGHAIELQPGENLPAAQAFRTQRPVFVTDVPYTGAASAGAGRPPRTVAVLAAPITAGAKRLGVLVVYAPRAPIFADDDLALVQLLADQAAVILESRALIDEAAQVRAREEAARLKEDFLSAAAHDLKTPLTTLVARAQFLERRALRDPSTPADLASIQQLVHEGQRLKRLVLELLDASRTEQGRLVGERAPVDLVAIAQEICARHDSERHGCAVEADGPVVGAYDQHRIAQLLENLVDNATKYSPEGGAVRIKIWRADEQAHISVSDSGIGIPPDDLPHIFERFYRAGNVDDRRFMGMGLGLFICRGIVEQHDGEIKATSRPGQGSTFSITLPLAPVGAVVYA